MCVGMEPIRTAHADTCKGTFTYIYCLNLFGIATAACYVAFIYIYIYMCVLYIYMCVCAFMVFLCSYPCSILRIPTCTCVIVCTSLFHVMVKRQNIFHICLCIRLRAYSFQVRKFGSQIWPQTLVQIVGTQQLLKGLLGGARDSWADSWLKFHPRTQPAGGWMAQHDSARHFQGGYWCFYQKVLTKAPPKEMNDVVWCSSRQWNEWLRPLEPRTPRTLVLGVTQVFVVGAVSWLFFKSRGFPWTCRA